MCSPVGTHAALGCKVAELKGLGVDAMGEIDFAGVSRVGDGVVQCGEEAADTPILDVWS